MNLSLLLSLALLFLSPTHGLTSNSATPDEGSTLQVLHSPSFHRKDPLSWEARVLQTQSKDEARVQYLTSLVAGKSAAPIASARPNYVVRAEIGTPAQTMLMALDNSNDVAWIPCAGCVGCSKALFDSSKSTTLKALGCQAAQCKQVPNPTCLGSACSFNMTYGGSTLAANLSQDTLKLAADAVPGYTFGCIQKATGSSVPPQGLLGLGRGPLSLLSQTHSLYQSTFSYCLPSFKSVHFSGSLRLGPIGQPKRIKTTQLLRNPRRSQLYYVNMIGIRVGRRVLNIPRSALAFNPTTGAGTIFDSDPTSCSQQATPRWHKMGFHSGIWHATIGLIGPLFCMRDNNGDSSGAKHICAGQAHNGRRHGLHQACEASLRSRETCVPETRVGANMTVSSLGGFDTCYSAPIPSPPTITFMFAGMNVTLPPDNFLIHSSSGTTTCLAMAASPDMPGNVNSVLNVIASMQQQNTPGPVRRAQF
ncbi:eukaryotic aspartyl protease family protein [Actinidia rufa]|uniref:Eukaryotic aspartyl protease family protein n=1 Tax=Actinidia rufa TaxID=165716 RepID=A0A7J0DIR8_9ERIC|nr:eukaryotic aspartyl protease family protein [Actinidia rufa]